LGDNIKEKNDISLEDGSLDGKVVFSDTSFMNEDYIFTRIKVMHNMNNVNASNFEDEVIKEAEDTIKNKFLLANVIEVDGQLDFSGHDYRIEINKMDADTYKVIYEEKIIGIIPETCNPAYELDEENGKTYLWVDALVAKDYSNYAEDIILRYIEEGKDIKVSMEIAVEDYELVNDSDKDYFIDVKKYRYKGITFLGEHLSQGMEKAVATFDNKNENQDIEKMFAIRDKYENYCQKCNEEIQKVPSNEKDKSKEENYNMEDEKDKVEVKVKFELSLKQKLQKIKEAFVEERKTDDDGNIISYTYYYVIDATSDTVTVNVYGELEGGDWFDKYMKFNYSENEDGEISIDMESGVDVMLEYITEEEKAALDQMRADFEQLKTDKVSVDEELKEAFVRIGELEKTATEFETTLADKDNAIKELSEYKQNIETEIHTAQIDEIVEEFKAELQDNEEFQNMVEKAYEMEVSELEKELFALLGKSKFTRKEKVKKPSVRVIASQIEAEEEDKEDLPLDENPEKEAYGKFYDKLKELENN